MTVSNRSSKIKSLGYLLKNLGPEYFLELETLDPQYKCLERLSTMFSERELALISILGSIVAYKLSKRGEEYWNELVNFFLNIKSLKRVKGPYSIVNTFIEFLQLSKSNKVLLKQKMHRIKKLVNKGFHKAFFYYFDEYSQDLFKFWNDLAVNLNVGRKTKTVVFTVKMLYYAIRASRRGRIPQVPFEIPIPVDLRVFKVSYKLGLISNYQSTQKQVRFIQEIWQKIASISGIAPLHIDVLLWMLGSLNEYKELLLKLAKKYKKAPTVLKLILMVE